MARRIVVLLVAGLVASGLSGVPAAHAGECTPRFTGGLTCTGSIEGAEFRVEMPSDWNGTLLLYGHGYLPVDAEPPSRVAVTNRPAAKAEATEGWLLGNGYALAASAYSPAAGYHVERALADQIRLLDAVEQRFGRPKHTVATGSSLGATVALLLAERYPDRFAGVAAFGGIYDPVATWNGALDVGFAVKTLLAPGDPIDLVRPRDPQLSAQALRDALDRGMKTATGRARIALAAALNNVAGWYSAHLPSPTDPAERIRAQKEWLKNSYSGVFGPVARVDLERRAGGNPSWNDGVDYRELLRRSSQLEWVRDAYAAAGLDPAVDLLRLRAAPRISADPDAVDYVRRYGVPGGRAGVPVITVHTTGDGGTVPDQARWFGERVADPERLHQLYLIRGGHGAISGAEEILVLTALLARIVRGVWPDLGPERLNAVASEFGVRYQFVLDSGTKVDAPDSPRFTAFTPPELVRPSGGGLLR